MGRRGNYAYKETLCWSCKNAIPDGKDSGCPWSKNFKPVPGWVADEDMVKNQSGALMESYRVHECPKYVYG